VTTYITDHINTKLGIHVDRFHIIHQSNFYLSRQEFLSSIPFLFKQKFFSSIQPLIVSSVTQSDLYSTDAENGE